MDDAVGVDNQERVRRALEDAAVELDFTRTFFAHSEGSPPVVSNLRRVRVLLAYRQDLRQKGDELLDQLGIETRARLALNQPDRILDGPGLLVGAHRR